MGWAKTGLGSHRAEVYLQRWADVQRPVLDEPSCPGKAVKDLLSTTQTHKFEDLKFFNNRLRLFCILTTEPSKSI